MNHNVSLAAVLVFVTAMVVAPVAVAAPSGGTGATYAAQATETPTPDDNASVAPGEKLSGVVGVQGAEISGEVDQRTFGVQVAQANSNSSKADVVGEQLEDVEQRIDELEQRKQTLDEARENGSISEGEYRAKISRVAAELETAKALANASERTAGELPADVLAEKGINVTAIQALTDRAENLSGPEVARIAKSIAGPEVGQSMAGDKRPSEVGEVPGGAPNGTDAGPPNGTEGGAPNETDVPRNGTDQGGNTTQGGGD